MSRFFASGLSALKPYVPGEQPRDQQYIKLNTNESPFPPAPGVIQALDSAQVEKLNLYSDPTAAELVNAIADRYGLPAEQVFVGNGSDEVLAFAFYAYGEHSVTAPDISYGFYPVFTDFFKQQLKVIPLEEDFTIDPAKFTGADGMVVLANPNAQTGLYLELSEIEKIVAGNPDQVVLVDEAYIDFGGESAAALIERYDNLLVVQTFSKSRNLAGARVGFALGNAALIADLNTLRNSFNPYNLNRLSILAGKAAMEDEEYFLRCTRTVAENREYTKARLKEMGFGVLDSRGNFVLAEPPALSGKEYYLELKKRGVLVRYLGIARIENYVRITIGTREQMDRLLEITEEILKG